VWDAAQRQLRENGRGTRSSPRVRHPSILAGKLFDDREEPLIAVHGKVRYRYYVSRSLHHKGDARKTGGMRLPAREIETLVIDQLYRTINDPIALVDSSPSSPDEQDIPVLVEKARGLASRLREVEAVWSRRWSATLSIVSTSDFPGCASNWIPPPSAVISEW